MKLLIVGAGGQLGRCLQDRLSNHDVFETVALSSADLDITVRDLVGSSIKAVAPDIVINAAAYTAVDQAEDDPDGAYAVNASGTENLALACAAADIPLIHVSTDYVFNGEATVPYGSESATAPIGVYGESKLRGEKLAAEALDKLIILRTAWVYSEYGNNFVKTMLRLAESRDLVSVVDDQFGCPTYAGNIAAAIIKVCESIMAGNSSWGVYHYVDDQPMSWHAFAEKTFSMAKDINLLTKDMQVKAIPTSEFPTKVKRPAYSVLDTSTLTTQFSISPVDLDISLESVLRRLGALTHGCLDA